MDDDIIQASAARFLIDGNEEDAASVLLSCSFNVYPSGDTWMSGDEVLSAVHVELHGPRAAYETLNDDNNPISVAIQRAISAVLPSDEYVKHFTIHAEHIEIDPDWRDELLEIARGKGIHNQAIGGFNARTWMNLNFRSQSEIKIAQALDRASVFFLPNCKGRLGGNQNRKNREADFLICSEGKWGIIEVDGEPFHPPSRTTQDHERDRLFRKHGIRVVEHYDANRCYQNPNEVVSEFLKLLSRI